MSHIFVLDPFDGAWLEVPYRTLSRPAITLWEHRMALKRARDRHTSQVDEDMIFAAFDEMQEIERDAVRLSKSARRRKSRPDVDRSSSRIETNALVGDDSETFDSDALPPRPFTNIEEW